jgi:SpoIIAA-like
MAAVSGKTVAEHRQGAQDRRRLMPITFSIDMRASLIRTIGSEDVTLPEIDAHFNELSQTWPRGAKLDVLLDLSECSALPEISQLQAAASRIQVFGGRKRFGACAIVARRELLYGLMRVFELFAERTFVAVRVFRNEPSAMVWLRKRHRRSSRKPRDARMSASGPA